LNQAPQQSGAACTLSEFKVRERPRLLKDEIARHLGSNRNALYKLTHDARKRLKRGLEAAGFTAEDIGAAFAGSRPNTYDRPQRGRIGTDETALLPLGWAVSDEKTTAVVERYLDELAGDSPAEPIVRALLDRAVHRLDLPCATLLHRSFPRLTRPPWNVQADEPLGAVTERLLKALREVRPRTGRQLFAQANQHMRWELDDLARRLDEEPAAVGLRDELVPAPVSIGSVLTPDGLRMLQAIDALLMDEREAFDLERIQGMTQAEAAQVLGVSAETLRRRLSRGLRLLAERLADLRPNEKPPDSV
jgi:RNA polymerase sigma factor (sigma-70 family)